MSYNKLNLLNILSFFMRLTLLLPATAFSVGLYQSHESIREAAYQHIMERDTGYSIVPTITVNRLDSRLKLPACNIPLETFSSSATRSLGRITVGVRCHGNKPWSLYVSAAVGLITKVTVAARDLSRGSILTAADLKLAEHDIARLHRGFMEDPAQAIGKTLKRNLQQGRVLTAKLVAIPLAVKKGSRVTIIASSNAIQVRMQGKALSNGAAGERIQVQNRSSKRTLEATVISPGLVKISM